jgi:hypothetical protein
MSIFDWYQGRSNLYTANEEDRRANPNKYKYTPAQYKTFLAGLEAKGVARRNADTQTKAVVQSSFALGPGAGGQGEQGASLSGRSAMTSGGLAGLAGLAYYEEGGEVEEQGIGSLFETGPRAELIEPFLNPIVEHHLQNIADGKTVKRPNGTVSTVFTAQVDGLSGEGGRPTLIPTIWDGQELPLEDTLGVNGQMILGAIARAKASGKPWPTAATHEELREVDKVLHQDITLIDPEVAQKVLGEARRQQHEARRSGIGGLR